MAETLLSPGVLARENDNTFLQQQPIQAGASIVGPAVKGPVEIPTLVTTYSDYQNRFGTTFESGSDEFTYLTSVTAYNYFNNGGDSLLVTRVVSASNNWTFSSASITNTVSVTGGEYATGSFGVTAFLANTEIKLSYSGVDYRFIAEEAPIPSDNPQGRLYYFATGSTADATATNFSASFAANINFLTVSSSANNLLFSSSVDGTTYNGATFSTGSSSTFSTQATLGGGVNGVGTSTAFEIEAIDKGALFNNTSSMLSNGALSGGTSDSIRWEVASSDVASGQFSILVRRGDDNTSSKTVLEQWTNLSLDPKAPNYISAVIGDQKLSYNASQNYIQVSGDYPNASRYIRVKSVTAKTPDYFDNAGVAKTTYATSLPSVGSGSYGGSFNGGTGSLLPTGRTANYYSNINGTDTQGLVGSDYTSMLTLLANADDYVYNLQLLPGLSDTSYSSQITTAISNAQSRGDHLVIVDPTNYGATISLATTEANGRDTSYAAMYWPWLRTIDPDLGKNIWVPASTMIGGVYAFNDNSSEPWFAPAGINRGGLGTVIQAERKLSATNRNTLYEANVNPIATFPGTGVVVYGQKTLQKQASALDRINVRRLLIELKSYISQIALNLVFEQNTAATRNNFLAAVNPYLENVQARQGLYAFKVIMDDSNNTPDVIDRNQMVGQIFIQPTRTAEFIYLDFNLQPTGATFPS
tara:strand:+ start:6521 stop:8614 length:2094 start_codon:yes stop_codon:yes gene_type:complete